MKIKLLILCIAVLCISTAPAKAATFGAGGGASLQGVLDGITTAPNPGVSSVNVLTDDILDTADSLWSITGAGGSTTTLIIELAGFSGTNTYGIYDAANPLNAVQLFAGAAGAGSQAVVSIKIDGSIFVNLLDTGVNFAAGNSFGFYLDATVGSGNPAAIYYSDSSLNADGNFDHMYAYQGTNTDTVQLTGLAPGLWTNNEYVFAWEDLWGGGDKDFDDFVVMVESIVPVPGAILLAILGMGVAGVKLRKFA